MASEKFASVLLRTGGISRRDGRVSEGIISSGFVGAIRWRGGVRSPPFSMYGRFAIMRWVTITNRWQNFPPWFDLHPLEVSGQFIPWMKERMEARDYPEEPIDGPNIWRVKGGDRVVWVGLPRSEQTSVDGVLGIVDCRAAVAVLGTIQIHHSRS